MSINVWMCMIAARKFSGTVMLVAMSLLPAILFGQEKPYAPIKTTLCEIMKTPDWYAGKMVEIRVVVSAGFETSLLREESCGAAIWFPGPLVTMISFVSQRPAG